MLKFSGSRLSQNTSSATFKNREIDYSVAKLSFNSYDDSDTICLSVEDHFQQGISLRAMANRLAKEGFLTGRECKTLCEEGIKAKIPLSLSVDTYLNVLQTPTDIKFFFYGRDLDELMDKLTQWLNTLGTPKASDSKPKARL